MITNDILLKLAQARPEYQWKVQTAKANGAICVAYIDARDVMKVLDSVVGPAHWADSYREVAGKVYCDLAIKVGDEWISKSDCGTESSTEKEKGQASDAFKRAAVKWGIGRFLYDLDIITIREVVEIAKGKYAPAHKGQRIWDLNAHIRAHKLDKAAQTPAPTAPTSAPAPPQKKRDAAWEAEELLRLKKQIHVCSKRLQWDTQALDDFSRMMIDVPLAELDLHSAHALLLEIQAVKEEAVA